MSRSPELEAALAAAEAAARVIRELYQKNVAVRLKEDKSPVTEADVRAEEAIREVLSARFPGHAFYGEETGRSGASDSMWLVDPIDGTKAFVREYPMFSTQIALLRGGRLVLGVSSAPVYGELAWAERGGGAWLNGRPLRVSAIDSVEAAALSAGNLRTLASSPARWAKYGAVVARLNRIRGYGDFLHYHLLAGGKIDAVVESDVNVLDVGALVTIVEEAGGRFTDLDGREVGLDTTTVLASNGVLHGPLLDALRA
jgi:histidinol-phosphatase